MGSTLDAFYPNLFAINQLFVFVVSGTNADGKKVFLKEIWPTRSEIQNVERHHVLPAMFKDVYLHIETGSPNWQSIVTPKIQLYPWDAKSTYIKKPPFFDGMTKVRVDRSYFARA